MIQHILKIVWKGRRLNAWIILELVIVFSILWFCSEYLYITGKHYLEPTGFDIEHTYIIGISKKETDEKYSRNDIAEFTETMLNRIRNNPMIESACLSSGCHPYGGNRNGTQNVIVNDRDTLIKKKTSYEYPVSPEYFDVFKVKVDRGRVYDKNRVIAQGEVMISPDDDNTFYGKSIDEIHTIRKSFWGTNYDDNPDGKNTEVVGVTQKIKYIDYEPYINIYFYNMPNTWPNNNICIRVKPEADKDFVRKFEKEMSSQLEIGPFFLFSVTSIEQLRDIYLTKYTSYNNNFKSIFSIGLFLLVNIFLGVIGTFWFRTQARRNEIGLRMALGSSRKSVKNLFINETIILLFIASIIAAIICVNVSLTDILKIIGMPSLNKEFYGVGSGQYIINYCITFIVLAFISISAVWYPANKASKVQPAIVLKEE